MQHRRKVRLWSIGVVAGLLILGALFVPRLIRRRPVVLQGAVVQQNADTNKELPVADTVVTAVAGQTMAVTKSDASGFFGIVLPVEIRRGTPIVLKFRHADYRPLDLKEYVSDGLYIARLEPAKPAARPDAHHPETVIANLRVRYSIKAVSAVNIGSAVRAFQVENKGNVPCNGQSLCSPDGRWKAGSNSVTLDAGEDNEFRNARASCIAGPCPFTRVDANDLVQGGRTISVSALDWSDTATFLLEAEVFRTMISDMVRESYPVIFGPALNFTLPASAEGITIEADVNGEQVVFPLGPALLLSWAECNARVNPDQTKVYRCQLKPGYRFR